MSPDELDKRLRGTHLVAVERRPPARYGEAGPRIGTDVTLLWSAQEWQLCVETYRDEGGYGQRLSRATRGYATLAEAVSAIERAGEGFSIEDLTIPQPRDYPGPPA